MTWKEPRVKQIPGPALPLEHLVAVLLRILGTKLCMNIWIFLWGRSTHNIDKRFNVVFLISVQSVWSWYNGQICTPAHQVFHTGPRRVRTLYRSEWMSVFDKGMKMSWLINHIMCLKGYRLTCWLVKSTLFTTNSTDSSYGPENCVFQISRFNMGYKL